MNIIKGFKIDPVIVAVDDKLHRLNFAVLQAVEQFINNKGRVPTRVFFSADDFEIDGEIEVSSYKVVSTKFISKGNIVVTDDTPLPILDGF